MNEKCYNSENVVMLGMKPLIRYQYQVRFLWHFVRISLDEQRNITYYCCVKVCTELAWCTRIVYIIDSKVTESTVQHASVGSLRLVPITAPKTLMA